MQSQGRKAGEKIIAALLEEQTQARMAELDAKDRAQFQAKLIAEGGPNASLGRPVQKRPLEDVSWEQLEANAEAARKSASRGRGILGPFSSHAIACEMAMRRAHGKGKPLKSERGPSDIPGHDPGQCPDQKRGGKCTGQGPCEDGCVGGNNGATPAWGPPSRKEVEAELARQGLGGGRRMRAWEE